MVFLLFVLFSSTCMAEEIPFIKAGVINSSDNIGIDKIAVELWTAMANTLGLKYVFVKEENEAQAFSDLQSKMIDVIVGPVLVNHQIPNTYFMQSYSSKMLTIVLPASYTPSVMEQFIPYLKALFSKAVSIFVGVTLLFSFLIWLAERKANSMQFSYHPLRGIGAAIWLTLSTLTTIGYGDKTPVTLIGRVLAVILMFISLFMVSSLTVAITAELASIKISGYGIKSPHDLSGKQVVYVEGDETAKRLINYYGGIAVNAKSYLDAVQSLESDKVFAGFLDRMQTLYYLKHTPNKSLQLIDYSYSEGNYAFVARRDYPYIQELNEALFTMQTNGKIEAIEQNWLGQGSQLTSKFNRQYS